jgi:hypothetical protein
VITFFTYKDYEDEANNSESAIIGIAVFAMVVALLLFVLETPFCHCFGAVKSAKEHYLLSPFSKAIIYTGLSIPMFLYLSPQICSGAFLLLTAIFEFMAQCQKSQDAADQARVSTARSGTLKQPLSGQV